MRLTEDQLAEFHREGFIVVNDIFAHDDLQPVRDEITRAIDRRSTQLIDEGRLSRLYSEEPFERRLTRITAETEAVYWTIMAGQLHGQGVFNLITNPKLLEAVGCLVGSEIIASAVYRLRPKVPGFPMGVVPWHQDSGYFEPYCDSALIVTVWIPLVDATVERGCLQVIPCAHLGEVYHHRHNSSGKYLVIPDDRLPPGEPVPVPVACGGALFLTNRTPHCSGDNVTDVIRWSMDLRYQGADLPTNYHSPSGWLNDDLPDDAPVACYPPEADFLVRSQSRPSDVVRKWEVFRDLRKNHERVEMTQRWDG
jgi:hypothetical protein